MIVFWTTEKIGDEKLEHLLEGDSWQTVQELSTAFGWFLKARKIPQSFGYNPRERKLGTYELTVWQCSIPCGETSENITGNFEMKNLNPLDVFSRYFHFREKLEIPWRLPKLDRFRLTPSTGN